jgi:hypothetical protein
MATNKQWIVSDYNEPGETTYFFHRNYSGVAHVTLDTDGSIVFEGYQRKVIIRNIGTLKEQVVIEKAADLVV